MFQSGFPGKNSPRHPICIWRVLTATAEMAISLSRDRRLTRNLLDPYLGGVVVVVVDFFFRNMLKRF